MIKTHELRLGNIVSVNKGFEMTVVAIFKDTVYLDFEGNEGDIWEEKEEDIFPVPLTEELLLKFGYWKLGNKDVHFVIKGHSIWKCNDLFMCDKNGVILKHIHQLQNLSFALKKEELTIKK